MFVHGWYHKDTAEHHGVSGLKARYIIAGEGEFLGLSSSEAARRMKDGRALVTDIIGRKAARFIAPAWLYGPCPDLAASVSYDILPQVAVYAKGSNLLESATKRLSTYSNVPAFYEYTGRAFFFGFGARM